MKTFTLAGFAAFLGELAIEQKAANHHALEHAAQIVEREAKRVIGTYDYGWPELSEYTKGDRESQGYEPDEPLLRTGEMRDSINHVVDEHNLVAHVGSDDMKAVWNELGTKHAPARSFLAGAAHEKEHEVVDHIGRIVHASLVGPNNYKKDLF